VILGGLMGDGALSPTRSGHGARFRFGHGARQAPYAAWKASLFANVGVSRSTNADSAVFCDLRPLPELAELRHAVYSPAGKVFSYDYLKQLTPLSLALWYMDDASFAIRAKGLQERTRDGSGRAEICVQAMEPTTRVRLAEYLSDTWDLRPGLIQKGGQACFVFSKDETARLHTLIAPFVHPSMDYKLLPRFRGQFSVEPSFIPMRHELIPLPITNIGVRPPSSATHRFDIEVEGTHNYFVDGVMVHNSPETTPGGRALKFYASVRLDIRRIESIKEGVEVVGNRTRVKVVKNKCVAEGTLVFDPTTGITHRIEDIVDDNLDVSVVAADKLGILHTGTVTKRFDQGEQPVIGLRLRDKTELRVTPDHQVLTDHGWRQAGQLEVGARVARVRHASAFGTASPVTPDQARLLGYLIGDGYVGGKTPTSFINTEPSLEAVWGHLAPTKRIPPAFFAADVSEEVVANLVFGLLETDGYVSREQTGSPRIGYTTSSEQLAHQLHWMLLRWGISSSIRGYDPTTQRPSIVKGRRIQGRLPMWEVRISGIDNVSRFAEVIPMWGPRGQVLVAQLERPELRKHRGSQQIYLPAPQTEPVLDHLRSVGVTAVLAAQLIGDGCGDPKGGLRQVLGHSRLRRDRIERLAGALDSQFLRDVLSEDLYYDRVVEITPAAPCRTFDLEVDEFHTFVADGVIVHNCSAPFRQAEFDIMYGKGISREGSVLDVAVDLGIVKKSGAWYTYDGEQLGQGRENAKTFLAENPPVMIEIYDRVREQVGITSNPGLDTPLGHGELDSDDEPISLD